MKLLQIEIPMIIDDKIRSLRDVKNLLNIVEGECSSEIIKDKVVVYDFLYFWVKLTENKMDEFEECLFNTVGDYRIVTRKTINVS